MTQLPDDVRDAGSTDLDSLRNRVAAWLANRCLALATPRYRSMVCGSILYGLNSAARDAETDAAPPPDYRRHYCDAGDFDRTICPEPCGYMHSYCTTCGARAEGCPHDVEVEEMTAEQTAAFNKDHLDPTDPDLCTCGHDGLARSWHLQGCSLSLR